MARNSSSKVQKRRQSAEAKGGRVRRRTKVCYFCSEHVDWVDYKDTTLLRRFVNDRGRIKARTATGTCAQHQRDVAVAIKTARELVLLPYVVRTPSPDRGDRRGRRPRPDAEAAPAAAEADGAATEADGAAEGGAEVGGGAGADDEPAEDVAATA